MIVTVGLIFFAATPFVLAGLLAVGVAIMADRGDKVQVERTPRRCEQRFRAGCGR